MAKEKAQILFPGNGYSQYFLNNCFVAEIVYFNHEPKQKPARKTY